MYELKVNGVLILPFAINIIHMSSAAVFVEDSMATCFSFALAMVCSSSQYLQAQLHRRHR